MIRCLSVAVLVAATPAGAQQLAFTDATAPAGLAGIDATRLCLVDLNGDTRPDSVVRAVEAGKPDRFRVFLNEPGEGGKGARFVELERHGLPAPRAGDCLVFADLDNDGRRDALFVRYLDVNADNYQAPPAPGRTCWLPGNGDGTFGEPVVIEAAAPATSACVAVGELDVDGVLDLVIGNWYVNYGASNEAYTNTVLRGRITDGQLTYEAWDIGVEQPGFDEETDAGGRPTYGVLIAHVFPLIAAPTPQILELNYGRRWNRLLSAQRLGFTTMAPFADLAPSHGLDGDRIRHGRYPDWLKERARTDPRFDRPDEKPYRSNGNTFDAAVGDVDNDGDFDVFLAEITHGWAGDSSDRSRFLVNRPDKALLGATFGAFESPTALSVDRLPADPSIRNWNQGDLFCELADFDHDGRLDLLLSSGDYPDNQRLRLFRQQDDGSFQDVTSWVGLDHEGSQQISLGDVDLDGDLDVIVGQSFNRLSAAQIAGRSPALKLYLNQTVERREGRGPGALTLVLRGDVDAGIALDPFNAIVRATVDLDHNAATTPAVLVRQLIGPGGHAGKQNDFVVHLGIGEAQSVDVEVTFRGGSTPVRLEGLAPGRHVVAPAGLQK